MWKITHDYISIMSNQVGVQTPDFDIDKAIYKFRLYDDDDVLYYEGLCDTNDDDNAFEPLDYYMNDSGCTYIEYYDPKTGKWEPL